MFYDEALYVEGPNPVERSTWVLPLGNIHTIAAIPPVPVTRTEPIASVLPEVRAGLHNAMVRYEITPVWRTRWEASRQAIRDTQQAGPSRAMVPVGGLDVYPMVPYVEPLPRLLALPWHPEPRPPPLVEHATFSDDDVSTS